MEDVLEVYHRQYGDNEVLVCLDETSKQQTKETRLPRPARPGASGVYDYEYECNGVSNMFMLFAPLEGWRRVEVTDRRTRADWARVVELLVDVDYADKDRIVLVMDNLNTHHPASLYEAFEPAEARRIAERLEIHYTPKHGRTIAKLFDSHRQPRRWQDSKVGTVDSRFRGKDGLGQIPLCGKTLQSSCQAWELAEHGGDRNRGAVPAMSGPPHTRPTGPAAGGGGVAGSAQPGGCAGGLALHHRGRPHQTEVALPINTTLTHH